MPPVSADSSHNAPPQRSRMPALFNLIRSCVYGTVLLFTLICVSMAGHFQSVLTASDLTRFVPFAIFVCSASLFIFIILLGFSFFLRERNPISTRIELSCLGLAAIFWLVLGVYLATSDSQSADVECFASESSTEPLDDSVASFQTEQYQAMYRVLLSFALMNAALVLLFCFMLLFLAVRRHSKGDEHMWHGPVTSCAWFNNYGNGVKRGNSGASSSSVLPIVGARNVTNGRGGRRGYSERRSPYAHGRPTGRRTADIEKPLPAAGPMRQTSGRSGDSSLIGSHSTDEFERGGMMNPNAGRAAGRTRGSR